MFHTFLIMFLTKYFIGFVIVIRIITFSLWLLSICRKTIDFFRILLIFKGFLVHSLGSVIKSLSKNNLAYASYFFFKSNGIG